MLTCASSPPPAEIFQRINPPLVQQESSEELPFGLLIIGETEKDDKDISEREGHSTSYS